MVSKLQCELLEEGAWSQNFSVNCWRRGVVLKLQSELLEEAWSQNCSVNCWRRGVVSKLQCELLEEGRGLKTSV